jgi:hypothetical protein
MSAVDIYRTKQREPMPSHAEQFWADGYLRVSGIFSASQIDGARRAVDRVRSLVDEAPDQYKTRYTGRAGPVADTWGVDHLFAPELYQPEFADLLETDKVLDTACEVLLADRLRFWRGHAYWDPRRADYSLYWHRDYGEAGHYHPEGRPTHAHLNICLWNDSSLRIAPGSHRRPLTSQEDEYQRTKSTGVLPGEQVVHCSVGDLLLVNAHLLHRGSCQVGTRRGTLHVELQSYDEPTGGQGSWRFMRAPGYLDTLPQATRQLMENAIAWDDAHRLSLRELAHGRRLSRTIEAHEAKDCQ